MFAAVVLMVSMASGDSTGVGVGPLRTDRFEQAEVQAAAPDAWLGADKFKHFAMSYAITAFAFAGARSVFDSDTSLGLALAAGSTAGLLKEFYDRSHGRAFSARDLAWDAAGIALGFVMVRQTTWK